MICEDAKYIKPIPKYMLKRIKAIDEKACPEQNKSLRFYAYLTTIKGKLVKITVAVKNRYKKWYCKQVVVHAVHSEICLLKDIVFYRMGGYKVGWYDEGLSKYRNWYEDKNWGYNDDKYFNMRIDVINKEYISKLPEYKYSAYEQYPYTDILQYLRRYEKYPQVEYLTKLGLANFTDKITILELIGKDKYFAKWLIKNKDRILYHYDVVVIIRAYKTGRDIKELQEYENFKKRLKSDKQFKKIKELFNGKVEQYFLYSKKQQLNTYSYLDYINACEFLHIDLSLEKNLIPHDFKRWHDIRIDEYHTAKAIQDEKERQELYKQFMSVAEKYLPLQYNKKYTYVSIIAQKPSDLVFEGDTLHHCVGRMNYDQKIIREETLIFFIREKEKPNIPLVTVEYSVSSHKVLQCYADHDSKPNEEIEHFVHKIWLPHANKQIKKLQAA